jgi:hypothetical protein
MSQINASMPVGDARPVEGAANVAEPAVRNGKFYTGDPTSLHATAMVFCLDPVHDR